MSSNIAKYVDIFIEASSVKYTLTFLVLLLSLFILLFQYADGASTAQSITFCIFVSWIAVALSTYVGLETVCSIERKESLSPLQVTLFSMGWPAVGLFCLVWLSVKKNKLI